MGDRSRTRPLRKVRFRLLLLLAALVPSCTAIAALASPRHGVRLAAPVCCSAAERASQPATAQSRSSADVTRAQAGRVVSTTHRGGGSGASSGGSSSAKSSSGRGRPRGRGGRGTVASTGGGRQRAPPAAAGAAATRGAAVPTAATAAGAGATAGGGRGGAPAARKRRSGGARGGGRRKTSPRRDATRALGEYIETLEPKRLLEHSEEIQTCRQVQRLKELEEIYSVLYEQRQLDLQQPVAAGASAVDALDGPTALPEPGEHAVFAGGGMLRSEWAVAANVSVAELRTQLNDGRRARERIVTSNMGLVGSLVQKLKRASGGRIDTGTTEGDLMQEGCIALLRAAERFDVSLGVRFSTYATFWARAGIKNALHEQSRVVRLPARVHHTYGKIKRATDALQAQAELKPSDEQVAAELAEGGVHLTPSRVRQVIDHVRVRPSSLDTKLNSDGEGASVLDLIVDDTTRIESDVVQNMLRTDLGRLMAKHLRPQEVDVLTLRFGLGDGHARTVRQTADELGMPYATVKHMLFQAMNKMRKPHVAIALKDYLADAIEVDD